MSPSDLAPLNAALNAIAACFLAIGYVFIRSKKVGRHRVSMILAFVSSAAFLVSYLIYHYHAGSVAFTGQGWVRPVYFVILITHIILAAIILPLAIETLRRAWRHDFARHRRIARWTLPLWLYVSATGVLIYWMLYWAYPSS
jgi:putative membrane protein